MYQRVLRSSRPRAFILTAIVEMVNRLFRWRRYRH